jgi:uncharacterized protein (TIGR03435 family)
LNGEYDPSLEWASEQMGGAPQSMEVRVIDLSAAEPSFPSLITAIQEQLGLKLQQKKINIYVSKPYGQKTQPYVRLPPARS